MHYSDETVQKALQTAPAPLVERVEKYVRPNVISSTGETLLLEMKVSLKTQLRMNDNDVALLAEWANRVLSGVPLNAAARVSPPPRVPRLD